MLVRTGLRWECDETLEDAEEERLAVEDAIAEMEDQRAGGTWRSAGGAVAGDATAGWDASELAPAEQVTRQGTLGLVAICIKIDDVLH